MPTAKQSKRKVNNVTTNTSGEIVKVAERTESSRRSMGVVRRLAHALAGVLFHTRTLNDNPEEYEAFDAHPSIVEARAALKDAGYADLKPASVVSAGIQEQIKALDLNAPGAVDQLGKLQKALARGQRGFTD